MRVEYIWQCKHGKSFLSVCKKTIDTICPVSTESSRQQHAVSALNNTLQCVCVCELSHLYRGLEIHLLSETCWLVVNAILLWLVNCLCIKCQRVYITYSKALSQTSELKERMYSTFGFCSNTEQYKRVQLKGRQALETE